MAIIAPQAHFPPAAMIKADLKLIYKQEAVDVYANKEAKIIPLDSGAGMVIGWLFSRETYSAISSLSHSESDLIVRSRGRHLIDQYWGGYVAIIRTEDGVCVMRDPSGGLTCLSVTHNSGARIFSSDIETLCDAHAIEPSVHWQNLATHLAFLDLPTSATCLTGVEEVLAGSCWHSTREGVDKQMMWSPWDYVHPTVRGSAGDEVGRLNATVQACVEAWASEFTHVLQGVSGGLDSSILASVLVGAEPDLTLLNMSTDEGQGDETVYARILADAISCELHEYLHSLAATDISVPTSAHLPRPLQLAFGQSERDIKFRLAKDLGVDGFFSGIGGDNVFCHIRSATPLVDRFRAEGLCFGLFETLDDICILTGCTYHEAISGALDRSRRPAAYRWQEEVSFLSPDMACTISAPSHPWLDTPKSALPGKAVHIAMLTRIQATIDGFSRRSPPQINPLLSQPIVDLCLSIPTWIWICGGKDRSLARMAFGDRLPTQIIDRRSKGSPNSFAYEVLESDKAVARSLLMDGLLMQNGILDRDAVGHALRDDRPIDGNKYMRLSLLLEAETWGRHWT